MNPIRFFTPNFSAMVKDEYKYKFAVRLGFLSNEYMMYM